MRIGSIEPTVFLRRRAGALQQRLRLTLSASTPVRDVAVRVDGAETALGAVPVGESTRDLFVEKPGHAAFREFVLLTDGAPVDSRRIELRLPREWTVHVVQLSHHDVGYTNLPSRVLREQDAWLIRALQFADETAAWPEDARFRIVIEQAWSLVHFLRNAAPERAVRMIELLRSGQFEVSALFGNMTTELCGHETLIRTLYHAFALKREHGIPLTSAEHNDVPGLAWGLSEVLADAGVQIFCPSLPRYYNWGETSLPSFWDEERMYAAGDPGAFWWESPSGRRLLFWSGRGDCGGGPHPKLPRLAPALHRLEEEEYPYSVVRCVVRGGARDNSPYIRGFAETIRDWNEKWASPRLICSTNALSHADLLPQLPDDLPVFRGELPGQDYPVGATSTAAATGVNRRNHARVLVSERIATAAATVTDYAFQAGELADAHEDILWHDEHTWGHHFPCGPAAAASELEKAVHAYRAAALCHDVINRSLARIADHIDFDEEGLYLVVFNPTSRARSGPVRLPMREIENCGSTMAPVRSGAGYLRGYALTDRWHVHPPEDVTAGKFELIDLAEDKTVAFQMVCVEDADEPVPCAAQRDGIGSGTRRYGFFEMPSGLKRDLVFHAEGVPPCGYRAYRFVPRDEAPRFAVRLQQSNRVIENDFYRIEADAGGVRSVLDKEANRELIDCDCAHRLGTCVVRGPRLGEADVTRKTCLRKGATGPVMTQLVLESAAFGHPAIRQTITLHDRCKRIDVAARILKSPEPLLDVHVAFPFAVARPRFRYEGALAVMKPIADYFPGAFSDRIAVQNWVRVADDDFSILWSSLDAPVISLGGLWPGYVSPAHRAVVGESIHRTPLRPSDLVRGWIYSNIFGNNFGTNFAVSQVGSMLFRYCMTSGPGEISDADSAAFGWRTAMPFETIFTEGGGQGRLPHSGSFLRMENASVELLTLKTAEDGRGLILRLWNSSDEPQSASVRMPHLVPGRALRTNIVEEDQSTELVVSQSGVSVDLGPREVATIRIIEEGTPDDRPDEADAG